MASLPFSSNQAIGRRRPRTSAFALLAMMSSIPIGLLYALVPPNIQKGLCPPATFRVGPMGAGLSGFGYLITFFSLMMLGVYFSLRDAASNNGGGRQFAKASYLATVSFLVAPLCGIGVGGFLWINSVHSYYCVTPENVLFHSSLFGRSRLVAWDDIITVQPMCRSGKSSHRCGLQVTFAAGEEIYLPLSNGNVFLEMTMTERGQYWRVRNINWNFTIMLP